MSSSPSSSVSAAWLRRVAAELGLPEGTPRPLTDADGVNVVVVVGTGADRWVIRAPKDLRSADVFAAEQWSARQARSLGIATPAVTHVGTLDDRPFSAQRFVAGTPALDAPHRHDELWTTLGEYCLRIGEIQPAEGAPDVLFSRFGADLPAAWTAHLDYNLDQLDADDRLLRIGALSTAEQRQVADRIEVLRALPPRFGLSHGDLALRNLVLPDPSLAGDAAPTLIDWGSAAFGPVPWRDLYQVDRDRRREGVTSWRQLGRFAEAAGVDLTAEWDTLVSYRLLQHVDLVRWALDRRPDLVPDTIAQLREVLDDTSTPAPG